MPYLDRRVNFTRLCTFGLIKINRDSLVAGRMVVTNPTSFRADVNFWSWGMVLLGSVTIGNIYI